MTPFDERFSNKIINTFIFLIFSGPEEGYTVFDQNSKVDLQFRVWVEELQGGFLEVFKVIVGQFSVDFPNDISDKKSL